MRNRTAYQIELTLIRHGRTASNGEGRYLGRTEEDLSDAGRCALMRKKDSYPHADLLFASPMRRCIQTADILYPGRPSCLVPEFREMDFGAFEGKNYQDLKEDVRYQAWIDSSGTLPFPQGESRETFIKRCQKGFAFMLEQIEHAQMGGMPKVSAVVHGGTIMALMESYAEEGKGYFDYQCKNGGGYRCLVCWYGETEPEIGKNIRIVNPVLL